MACSIVEAVARIKRGPAEALGRARVEAVCRELGHAWRDRELDPATTVALFVQQVAHGNVACSEVRHLAGPAGVGDGFSGSAYCQARIRLPAGLLRRLGDDVAGAALGPAGGRWLGHRTLLVDGTSFSMPDVPQLRSHYGTAGGMKQGVGFPASHLLVLFDADSGLLLHAGDGPLNTSDLSAAPAAHERLGPGDVLVGDGHFGTYAHLALLAARGCHGLFPVHHNRVVDFTPGRPHAKPGVAAAPGTPRSRWVKSLGRDDQLVEYFKPPKRSPWLTREQWDALPDSLVVREVRRTVDRGETGAVTLTMVTTLTDPARYPAEAAAGVPSLVQLRLGRWAVETDIAHLKTTMGMHTLRCKTVQGVRKELDAFRLVYNLVRVVMLEAADRQGVAADRISFADALRWLRHARPGDPMPRLLVNPRRKPRVEPRAVKRRPKVYDRLTGPREQYRQKLRERAVHA